MVTALLSYFRFGLTPLLLFAAILGSKATGSAQDLQNSTVFLGTEASSSQGDGAEVHPAAHFTPSSLTDPDPSLSEIESLKLRLQELEETVQRLSKEPGQKRAGDGSAPKQSPDKKPQALDKEYEVGSDLNFKTFWREGFNAETANKDFRVHLGGRVHADTAWFGPDENLEAAFPNQWKEGAEFRRLRFRGDGTMYEVLQWVLEVDFQTSSRGTANQPIPTDAFLSLTQLPLVGALDIGHYKEPFTFDDYGTPDNYVLLMERSPADNALGLARNMGLMFRNTAWENKVIWAAGVFRTNSDNASGNAFDYGNGEYAETARLIYMPFYIDEGRSWLAFGGAYSHRTLDPTDDGINGANPSRFRYAARIPIRVNSPFVVDTGNLIADSADLFNIQAAMVLGPFMIQSEYIHSQVHDIRRGLIAPNTPRKVDAGFDGFYVQTSYLLTGEHHPIDRDRARMNRVRPHEQFFFVEREDKSNGRYCCGKGAWEVVARYDFLDLRDSALNAFDGAPGVTNSAVGRVAGAGIEQCVTAGVNWYLSPNARLLVNYSHAFRDVPSATGDGEVHAVGARMLFDF